MVFKTEPPPSNAGKYQRAPWPEHVKIARRLQSHPGQWEVVRTANSTTAAAQFAAGIRHGRLLAFRDGKYEATVRGQDVHARFIDS